MIILTFIIFNRIKLFSKCSESVVRHTVKYKTEVSLKCTLTQTIDSSLAFVIIITYAAMVVTPRRPSDKSTFYYGNQRLSVRLSDVCSYSLGLNFRDILMKLEALTCFGSRTTAIENGSNRGTFSTPHSPGNIL